MKTEDIITFCKKTVKYNPQKIKLDKPLKYSSASNSNGTNPLASFRKMSYEVNEKYPTNVIEVDKVSKMIHPTQKPVALLEYLIKTYTNEGEMVLDNTMGSGSTGVACVNTNRKFIGIELDEKYYDISCKRIEEAIREKEQDLFK
jgi:site-specific DNA-methyltransferase (adenine-specific)